MEMFRRSVLLSSMLALVAMATWAKAGQSHACEQVLALESYAETAKTPPGATCSTFLGQGSKSGVSCHWAFTYRDVAAQSMANALWATIKSCRAGERLAPDQTVNHPDSFKLREWTTNGAIYRVSVKDKAGQRRTLVFFGYEKP